MDWFVLTSVSKCFSKHLVNRCFECPAFRRREYGEHSNFDETLRILFTLGFYHHNTLINFKVFLRCTIRLSAIHTLSLSHCCSYQCSQATYIHNLNPSYFNYPTVGKLILLILIWNSTSRRQFYYQIHL